MDTWLKFILGIIFTIFIIGIVIPYNPFANEYIIYIEAGLGLIAGIGSLLILFNGGK